MVTPAIELSDDLKRRLMDQAARIAGSERASETSEFFDILHGNIQRRVHDRRAGSVMIRAALSG